MKGEIATYFDDARAGFALLICSEGGADNRDGGDAGKQVRALLKVLRGKRWSSERWRVGRGCDRERRRRLRG